MRRAEEERRWAKWTVRKKVKRSVEEQEVKAIKMHMISK